MNVLLLTDIELTHIPELLDIWELGKYMSGFSTFEKKLINIKKASCIQLDFDTIIDTWITPTLICNVV